MRVIQIREDAFNQHFQATLDKLKLVSFEEGTINVRLNNQVEVTNFISNIHRRFHYEVVQLKDKLREG